MDRRVVQIGLVVLVSMGALFLLRVLWLEIFSDQTQKPGSKPEGTVSEGAPLSSPATGTQAQSRNGIAVASGRVFGRPWRLGLETSTGRFCVELGSAEATTSSCGYGGSSLGVVRAGAGKGRILLFGPLPSRAARVWMALQDGRVVSGDVFPVPRSIGAPFSLYLVPVGSPDPGEVVTVDHRGFLVDHAPASTSSRPGRPVGVVDVYGNVIGSVPIGDWDLPAPGRPAGLQGIRRFLSAPLDRLRLEVGAWWANRPETEAEGKDVKNWWAGYPLQEWMTPA